jgi:hypothetical protein
MSIAISCSGCGLAGNVPDSASGKTAKCRRCGKAVNVPRAAVTPAKICSSCGIDVSGQKRTKDTVGRYYCQPCWQVKVDSGRATDIAALPPVRASASVASSLAAPLPSRMRATTAPQVIEPDAGEDLDTLEECPQCLVSFPASELVLGDNDAMVCRSCARQEIGLADDLPEGPVGVDEQVQYAPPPLPKPVIAYRSPAPAAPRPRRSYGSSHDGALVLHGSIFAIGLAVTVGTYLTASNGRTYVVAWGAILFGGFRFFRALAGKLTGG